MSKAKIEIRIGTSGWHYEHWKGLFYPDKLPKTRWFEHYAQHLDTVEINNTFYRLPKVSFMEKWRDQAPKDFIYTVKASRYLTHLKRLKDPAEPLKTFFKPVNALKETLGPVLYQLPPNMHKNIERLSNFLKLLPKNKVAVMEFRHESWYCDDVYELLDKHNVGFCVHDMTDIETPKIITGDIIYIRFHGTTGKYEGDYPKSKLKHWARWIKENEKKVNKAYAYFNNDYNAYAVYNAKTLKQMLSK